MGKLEGHINLLKDFATKHIGGFIAKFSFADGLQSSCDQSP
jgi:hypothetical protein